MIKMIVLVARAEGMSPEEFSRYWREEHPEVVRSAPSELPPIRKYVQDHTLPWAYEEGDPDVDGVVELWYDDAASIDEWFGHDYYERRVRPDEEVFTDHGRTDFFMAQETAVDLAPTTDGMLKVLVPLVRAADVSPAEFHRYWRSDHVDRITGSPAWDHVEHYVQHHAIDEVDPEAEVSHSGVGEFWFEDRDALESWRDHWGDGGIVGPDADRFVDTDRTDYVPVSPETVI